METSTSNVFTTISDDIVSKYHPYQIDEYIIKMNSTSTANMPNFKSNTVYSGITTTDLLKKLPELQLFFDFKQIKYNRRRDSEDLAKVEKGLLPKKNIINYVSKSSPLNFIHPSMSHFIIISIYRYKQTQWFTNNSIKSFVYMN